MIKRKNNKNEANPFQYGLQVFMKKKYKKAKTLIEPYSLAPSV